MAAITPWLRTGRARVSPSHPTRLSLAALALVVPVTAGAAAAQAPLAIPRVGDAVTLDGRFDESAWSRALSLPMVGYLPNAGAPPSEATTVRILHDGSAIYVAAELLDSDPDGVQGWSRARDDDNGGDFINVFLDATGDRESGVVFSTTPTGARLDYSIANDAEGDEPSSIAWNGFWDVRVRRDARGWYAEFRIPFSTLRYQSAGDEVRMGLIVNRLIGRKSERAIFPAIEPRWSFGAFKPSRAQPVVFSGVSGERQRTLVPYVVAASSRQAAPQDVADAATGDDRVEAGGDLKLALGDNLNLDLTANTDFAETEADDQRIELSRLRVADPERRQFFLERAGVFAFSFGGDNQLLNTRRIGLSAEGERVPLHGGAHIVGRIGGLDVGALDMQTRAAAGERSTNFGAVRLRSRVLNEESFVGAMATTRAAPGLRDAAGGLDATLRLGALDYLRLAAATVDGGEGRSLAERSGAVARLERRSTIGLGASVGVLHLGSGFEPALGFLEGAGIRRAEARASYGFEAPRASGVRLVTPSVAVERTSDLEAGALRTSVVTADATVKYRSSAIVGVSLERRHEITLEEISLADGVVVAPGSYRMVTASALLQTPATASGAATLRLATGGFYGGHRTSMRVDADWHPFPALSTLATWVHERLVTQDDRLITLRLMRIRAAVAATPRQSGAVTLQHSSAAHLTSLSARWRFNHREGTDAWLVYDVVLYRDRDRVSPTLPHTASRALTLKVTYALSN